MPTPQNGGLTMPVITKDTIIGDILDIGMHCLGCPASRNETVEEACLVHDTSVDDLVNQLNELIAANKK